MGDPAGKEQEWRGYRKVRRVDTTFVKIIAGVINGHNEHDQTAQNVDRFNTLFWSWFG